MADKYDIFPKGIDDEFKEERFLDPTSKVGATVSGAGQGITLGFRDELNALLAAIARDRSKEPGFWDSYRKTRDENRADDDSAQAAHPGLYTAGEIGGGLMVPIKAPTGLKGLNSGAKVLKFAKAGAPIGAGFGAGMSREDLTKGEPENFLGAGLDTASGAAAGGAGASVAGPISEMAIPAGAALFRKLFQRRPIEPLPVAKGSGTPVQQQANPTFKRDDWLKNEPAGAVKSQELPPPKDWRMSPEEIADLTADEVSDLMRFGPKDSPQQQAWREMLKAFENRSAQPAPQSPQPIQSQPKVDELWAAAQQTAKPSTPKVAVTTFDGPAQKLAAEKLAARKASIASEQARIAAEKAAAKKASEPLVPPVTPDAAREAAVISKLKKAGAYEPEGVPKGLRGKIELEELPIDDAWQNPEVLQSVPKLNEAWAAAQQRGVGRGPAWQERPLLSPEAPMPKPSGPPQTMRGESLLTEPKYVPEGIERRMNAKGRAVEQDLMSRMKADPEYMLEDGPKSAEKTREFLKMLAEIMANRRK